MKKKPRVLHTNQPWAKVHHNNPNCTERNNVERRNIESGTGGLPLCEHCKDLN